MKKVTGFFVAVICLLIGSAIGVNAYDNLDYTLENGVLTVRETEGFVGELILPTDEMGEVNTIIMEETSGSSGVTALKLTAEDEIVIEKNAFFGHRNIKALELKAKDKVTLGGEGWDWDDRFDYGCFEDSGLEKVVIRTKELDMSDGWAFHECSDLYEFEAAAEEYAVGENSFTDYYWNGTKTVRWIPWIENNAEDFVYLGDVIIAYKGNSDGVYVPKGKLAMDVFSADGYDYDIKKIVLSDEITEIPSDGMTNTFSLLENLEDITLGKGITTIPTGCFRWNSNLKNIYLSKDVTEIGVGVFPENCVATIHYEGTEEEWNSIELLSKTADLNETMYKRYLDTLSDMRLKFNCEALAIGMPYVAKDIVVRTEGNEILLSGGFVPDKTYIGENVVSDGDVVAVVITFTKNGRPSRVGVAELYVGEIDEGVISFPDIFSFEFSDGGYDVENISVLAGIDTTEPIGVGNFGIPLARWR